MNGSASQVDGAPGKALHFVELKDDGVRRPSLEALDDHALLARLSQAEPWLDRRQPAQFIPPEIGRFFWLTPSQPATAGDEPQERTMHEIYVSCVASDADRALPDGNALGMARARLLAAYCTEFHQIGEIYLPLLAPQSPRADADPVQSVKSAPLI